MVEKSKYIWMGGKLVPWDDAQVHMMTHSLHYGLGAFEGIRCYKRQDGQSAIFRLHDHIQRLIDSCRIVTITPRFSKEELIQACVDVVRENDLEACYLRPLVFVGDGEMGLYAIDNPTRTAIIAWQWGSYLGDEGLKNGIRAKVSSFTRSGVNSAMVRGKLIGQYINSILAKREAVRAGYHEAIMLDDRGYVSEASGENIFMVKNGVVYTPPLTSPILAGITRDSVLHILGDMGATFVERTFTRDDMYIADEIFFTGTAAEVTPVREVDDRIVGAGVPGAITREVQARYFDIVKGSSEAYPHWLTPIR